MRIPMPAALLLLALAVAPPGRSDEPPAATEATDPATQALVPATQADESVTDATEPTASTAAAAERELVLPPGFKPKKRGKFVVYCKRDAVLGTRMPAEHCYDEEGIRAMLRAQAEDREKVDQMRRICGSMDKCGGGG
jgi:hypothetical protein